MARLGDFDANHVDPHKTYEPIPPGNYLAMIVESELVDNAARTGAYLKLQWQILEGDYQGRVVFDNLNLDNPSVKAVEIAQRRLSAICHACGKLQINDSEQLHNVPCVIKVGISPAKGDYTAQNNVKGYESNAGAVAPAAAGPQDPAGSGSAGVPVWKKKG